jgi:hypothetical protein
LKALDEGRTLSGSTMRMLVGPLLFFALLAASGAAGAQSRLALVDAARAFDESALRADDNNAKPMPVRKWMGAVRLSFANASAAYRLVEPSRQGIKTIASEAGIAVVDLGNGDPWANFVVFFDENGLTGYCFKGQRTLTELDRYLIRALYDPQLVPGMPAASASQGACRILAKWLKSAPADVDAVCANRTGPVAAN